MTKSKITLLFELLENSNRIIIFEHDPDTDAKSVLDICEYDLDYSLRSDIAFYDGNYDIVETRVRKEINDSFVDFSIEEHKGKAKIFPSKVINTIAAARKVI